MGQPNSVENPIHNSPTGAASLEIPSLDVNKVVSSSSNAHRKSLNFSEVFQSSPKLTISNSTTTTSPNSCTQHVDETNGNNTTEESTTPTSEMSIVKSLREESFSRFETSFKQKHYSISAMEYHRSSSMSGQNSTNLTTTSPLNSSSEKKKEHQRNSSSPRNLNSTCNESVHSQKSSPSVGSNHAKHSHIRPFSISTLDNLGFNGINKILQDKLLLQQFRNYTKTEYSEENLDIFLLANMLLEECKKFLEEDEQHSIYHNGISFTSSFRKSQNVNPQKIEEKNKQQLYKTLQSQFSFEEKMLKKLEKHLEQIFEKMQKMNSEKRKSLMKSRRKNSEFFGIDRNMFKHAHSAGVFDESNNSGSLFADPDVFSASLSLGGTSSSLDGLNVTHKLKNRIEKIKTHNMQQQQWLASKRASKRMSLKFFTQNSSNTSSLPNPHQSNVVATNVNSQNLPSLMDQDASLNQETLSQLSTLIQEMEAGTLNGANMTNSQAILSTLIAVEEPPQIQIVQFLEDLRFEMLMNLKDTYIRFCQQNKLTMR
ncbi:hypothetical protein C9374_012292 [Naegleria lovaniensis]|uniref:RGS domain-containing protein n=1 Tax=Naegleria lovaniensis TaxID=51637 RepID=A0AA88GEC5_NAELO|nr:uncharacterized protein C9374_012292 [Naegleria lovaniensis]KAG2373303.1 hypothetical protein C9374_012292 [Naegleria lovaniensis]